MVLIAKYRLHDAKNICAAAYGRGALPLALGALVHLYGSYYEVLPCWCEGTQKVLKIHALVTVEESALCHIGTGMALTG